MPVSLPPALATAVAAVAAGISVGIGFSASVHAWAASPLPTAWVTAASVAALAFTHSPGRAWAAIWVVGVVLLAGAERTMQWLGQWLDIDHVANLLPIFLPIVVAAAVSPAQPALRRASAPHAVLALAAAWLALSWPRSAAIGVMVVLTFAATRVDAPFLHWSPFRRSGPWWGPIAATVVATIGICIALIGRTRADVSLESLQLGIAAWVVGAAYPRGIGFTTLALAGAAFAAGYASQSSEATTTWLLVGVPMLAASALTGAVASGRKFVLAGLAATGIAAFLMVAVPTSTLVRALELPRATATARPDPIARALTTAPGAAKGSLAGPVAVWHTGERTIVELDGDVLLTTGRARDAERLAGVIAGCATVGRARARVVGDDFGAVASSLAEQGFSTIEVAAPDAELPGMLAADDSDLRALWLRAQVLLVAAPGPLFGWAGKPADILVFVTRRAFADARALPISDWLVDAASRALRKGGAFVAVVPALDSSSEVVAEAARAVAHHFPLASLWMPVAGAESAILVGAPAPIDTDRLSACAQRSRVWLGARGVQSAIELGALAIASEAWMGQLPAVRPARGAERHAPGVIGLALLDFTSATALSAFEPSLHPSLAPRQATTRAALSVFAASAEGDIELALRQAHAMADQPGASQALEPLIRPILDRSRTVAAEAAAEGPASPKWDSAIASIDGALIIHPASAEAQCLRGEILIARLQYDQAATALTRCTELAPRNPKSWDSLARVRKALGDKAGAEAASRKAVSLAPDWWEASLHLGLLLSSKGSLDEAERWLRRSAQDADDLPDEGRSRPHLALATVHLRRGAFELALGETLRADTMEPTGSSAYLSGAALQGLGRLAEAESKFRLAVQREPEHVEARHDLGVALAKRGDYVQAADAFRRVLAVQPDNATARQNLDQLAPMLRGLAPQ